VQYLHPHLLLGVGHQGDANVCHASRHKLDAGGAADTTAAPPKRPKAVIKYCWGRGIVGSSWQSSSLTVQAVLFFVLCKLFANFPAGTIFLAYFELGAGSVCLPVSWPSDAEGHLPSTGSSKGTT